MTMTMAASNLKFGIPDIQVAKAGGGLVNPSDFAGHQLVVLFCPTAPDAADKELAEYGVHRSELCENDAWIIGIRDQSSALCSAAPESSFSVLSDDDGKAWSAFQRLPGQGGQRREAGAVFLFGRGGALQHAWAGSGHVEEVMRELKQRR